MEDRKTWIMHSPTTSLFIKSKSGIQIKFLEENTNLVLVYVNENDISQLWLYFIGFVFHTDLYREITFSNDQMSKTVLTKKMMRFEKNKKTKKMMKMTRAGSHICISFIKNLKFSNCMLQLWKGNAESNQPNLHESMVYIGPFYSELIIEWYVIA